MILCNYEIVGTRDINLALWKERSQMTRQILSGNQEIERSSFFMESVIDRKIDVVNKLALKYIHVCEELKIISFSSCFYM